jgi:hypothetical protein
MLTVDKADYAARTAPAHRIIRLADELADELDRFQAEPLHPAEVGRLLDGMSGTAAALTRILDQLQDSPVLTQAEHDIAMPAHQSVLSELAQAAAAAEDLMVTAAGLSRILPPDLSTVDSTGTRGE